MSARTLEGQRRLESYVSRVVAEAPPLTEDQRHRIASLLGGHASAGAATPSPEAIARRNAEDALRKAEAAFQAALSGCHGCGLPAPAHRMQKGYAMGFHDFVPLSPDDVFKTAVHHKEIIDAAAAELEALGRE